MDMEDNDRRLD